MVVDKYLMGHLCRVVAVQLYKILTFHLCLEPRNFLHFSVSEEHSVLLPRRFLVFINPMAGSKKGKNLFEKVVQKMFDLAEVQYDVKYTGESFSDAEIISSSSDFHRRTKLLYLVI